MKGWLGRFVLWLGMSVVVGVGLGTTPAVAQRSDDDRARFHFEAGRSYFDEGNYERALEEWNRALRLSERPEMLANIATAYERLARYGEAADALQRFIDEVAGAPNRDVIERRIQNLRRRAEARQAEAPPDEQTASTEDARPPPEPVDEAEADTASDTVAAPEAVADAATTSAPAPAPEPRADGGGVPLPAWIGWGVGAAGLVTFAVAGSLALGEESEVADGCGATRTCGDAELDPIDTKAMVADIGLGIAIVGAAVGTVFFLTAGPDEESQVAVGPWMAPGAGGASVRGSF